MLNVHRLTCKGSALLTQRDAKDIEMHHPHPLTTLSAWIILLSSDCCLAMQWPLACQCVNVSMCKPWRWDFVQIPILRSEGETCVTKINQRNLRDVVHIKSEGGLAIGFNMFQPNSVSKTQSTDQLGNLPSAEKKTPRYLVERKRRRVRNIRFDGGFLWFSIFSNWHPPFCMPHAHKPFHLWQDPFREQSQFNNGQTCTV